MRLLPCFLLAATLATPLAQAQDAHAAKDPRNFDWVQEGVLAIGGGGLTPEDVDWLHAQGFRAIVDLRAEHQDPEAQLAAKGMTFLDMPIDSAADINATQLAAFVAWADEQEAAGRPMYVHCTNGWHRAAAFVVAWDMAKTGEDYDEAAREAVARRPGTAMRAVSGLLDHQAELRGEPAVAVTLVAAATRPEPNGTMPVHVAVDAEGRPAVGAKVRVWSEESKMDLEGVTGGDGRFTFLYTAPKNAFMDHLYARASLPGQLDGADNVELYFEQPVKARGALDVVAEETPEGVSVRVTSAGKPVAARVVVGAPGITAFEASDHGVVRFRDLPPGATIFVRAESWGSDGGSTTLALAPSAEPPAPREPHVEPAPEPSPLPHGRVLAGRYAIAALAGAACLLVLYAVLSRRSLSGTGSR